MCGNDTQIFHGFDAFSSGVYSTGEALPLGSNAGVTSSAWYGNQSAADAGVAAANTAAPAKTVNARAFISLLLPRLRLGRLTSPRHARPAGGHDKSSFTPLARGFRPFRAFKAVSISTLTKRVGWCGCNWPMRSMSAEITVPSMKYPPPDTASR